MEEAEWMVSDDPEEMLRVVQVSDRKLRLWVGALTSMNPTKYQFEAFIDWRNGEPCKIEQQGENRIHEYVQMWCDYQYDSPGDPPMSVRADVLRDIVGNPFHRMVVLPRDIGKVLDRGASNYRQENVVLVDWITPQVLTLAEAAYSERTRKACEKCEGKGGHWRCPNCTGEWRGDVGPDCFVCSAPRLDRIDCPACNGTGSIEDGTLDNVRLMVLADALEEAGCDRVACKCQGDPQSICFTCDGSGWLAHPVLAHLRSPDPHYRGMWSLDLIRGKE